MKPSDDLSSYGALQRKLLSSYILVMITTTWRAYDFKSIRKNYKRAMEYTQKILKSSIKILKTNHFAT